MKALILYSSRDGQTREIAASYCRDADIRSSCAMCWICTGAARLTGRSMIAC